MPTDTSTEENSDTPEPSGCPSKQRPCGAKKYIRHFLHVLRLRKESTVGETVAELIEEHDAEGIPLHPEERTILTNIIGFKQLRVEDVMVPRSDIIAISEDISLEALRQFILDKEHTRMPVYHDSLDNIKGFIHIKDLIRYFGSDTPFVLKDILRGISAIPASMLVIDLLMKMRASRVHIALVVDEHGGTDGLVTIEDLVEAIVGDIDDEHDTVEALAIKKISDDSWEISARLLTEECEKNLGLSLALEAGKDDFDTVGGLIFTMAGRIPATGETIDHPAGIRFKILEADPRSIKRVMAQKILPPADINI